MAGGAGGSGIVVVRITSMKNIVACGTNTVAVGEAPITIPYDARWGSDWTVTSGDELKATVEKSGSDVAVTGVAQGMTTVSVETADTIYNYTVYVAQHPYVVPFCEGDSVKIWYHNPSVQNWFLLINGVRYELGQLGAGNQVNVTLSPERSLDGQSRTTDTSIIATAETVGDPDHGDLVVISDGTNFYAYRMSCAPLREVAIGESTTMVCSTVAENVWHAAPRAGDTDYSAFIAVDNTNKETPNHSTTVTITGLELTDAAYLQAWDNEYDSAEENAQGAIYTLKVAVTGAPTIPVNLSAGVTMPVSWGARGATSETTYTVARTDEGDYTGISATLMRQAGTSFELDLSAAGAAPGMADFGKTATFTVSANGEPVVSYAVVVTYQFTGVNAMKVGQVAPGFLTGVEKTPWVTRSSNPEVVSVRPVLYNALYSGEARALKEGEATFYSTNAYWKAGYWGVYATVGDEHTTNISMPKNSTTNITVTHVGTFAGVWSVKNSFENLLTATIPASSEPSKEVEVTITSGDTVGPVTFQVANGHHTEYVNVFVDDETTAGKTKVLVPGKLTVVEGSSITLPADCVKTGWTATSANASVATVSASGAAGTRVTVNGISAAGRTPDGQPTSETLVTVVNDAVIYVYQVGVVLPEETNRDAGTINVGQTIVMPLTKLGNVTAVSATDPLIVSYTLGDGNLTLTGLQEGTTTLKVTTDSKIYYVTVTVRSNHIDKDIELVIGSTTKSTYSYTFDSNILWISNGAPDRVSAVVDGATVTFTPMGLPGTREEAQVQVGGYVDGLQTETTLHYWITIKEAPRDMEVWQDQGSNGYIVYGGAAEVKDNGTDLVLVYTNVNDLGRFQIPAPYTANVDILAVGGGGSGGSALDFGAGAGGGGAGGYSFVTDKKLTEGSFSVVVGTGGAVAPAPGSTGVTGGDSLVTNAFGYAFASAKGGGAGAGNANAGAKDGWSGGSGGGAAWYDGEAGAGGTCIAPGQGAAGGVPGRKYIGAGGGGAGGIGGADRTGGAGKTNAITGVSTLYAQGGKGGRDDVRAAGTAGQGPGFGGDGGSGAAGGAGADGVVIVHVKDVYRNIKVPIPTTNDLITARYVWDEGATCVGFAYEGREFRSSTDAHPHLWSDAIASVTGVVSTNCTLSATEMDDEDPNQPKKEGVGYYTFTIRLKDGYSWEDDGGQDTYGDTGARSFRWVVVKSEEVIAAAIDVHKSVTFTDASNATVTVSTFTSPEMSGGGTPRVLYLGTFCSAHALEFDTIAKSINVITEIADVDYYLTIGEKSGHSGVNPPTLDRTGTIPKGGTLNMSDLYSEGDFYYSQHSALKQFYKYIYEKVMSDPAKRDAYDYIVFEFDGSRIAQYYTTAYGAPYEHEAEVAAFLAPFYSSDSAIWLVDDATEKGHTEPVFDGNAYWQPNSYYFSSSETYKELGEVEYRGLVGMFAPLEYDPNGTRRTLATTTKTYGGKTYYANTRNPNQTDYNNVEALLEYLRSAIKVKPYNLSLRDKIVDPSKGLTVTNVTIVACTNEVNGAASTDAADWFDLIGWDTTRGQGAFPANAQGETLGVEGASIAVDIASNLVQCVLSNIDFNVWTKVKINVVDDGKFRTSEDAVYNQSSGMWEKNPNDGKAFAEMINSLGVAMKVDGDAETSVPWAFSAYKVTATAEYGEVFVDGKNVSEFSVSEGRGCTVYYRGKGGYRIKELYIDGVKVPESDLAGFGTSYTFRDIHEDHTLHVVYEPFFGTVETAPVTNVYDQAVHPYDVTLKDWDPTISNEVRFARWEDRFDETKYYPAEAFCASNQLDVSTLYNPEELTDVGDHSNICFRVFALQKGWAQDLVGEDWVWVQSKTWETVGNYGIDHSVILPAPLTVRPNDSGKIAAQTPLPDIGYTIKGFLSGEDADDLDGATADWKVVSVYKTGDGMGMYETWVADVPGATTAEGYALHESLIPAGDPTLLVPDGEGNVGNYYIKREDNFQPVERIPFSIGDVPQGPGLNPENPDIDTGVAPAKKMYDAIPTGIVVTVTSKDASERLLVENVDYKITYATADPSDPTHPTTAFGSVNPQFTHAGTYAVWYMVEGIGEQSDVYFTASNYQYVVITPRPLVLESLSETWEYDGKSHDFDVITLNSGTLATNEVGKCDVLTTNTTASITNVGTVPNDFKWEITSFDGYADGTNDYEVTEIVGALTVTPAHITIGETTYPDPDDKDYPNWGDHNTGVEDAIKVYDGIGTNIFVDVKKPGEGQYVIHYGTNTEDGVVWFDEVPVFTNVIEIAVYFAVEGINESSNNYFAVTNFALVRIDPRPVTVTAEDKEGVVGQPLPTLTAVVDGLIDSEKDLVDELIKYDLVCTNYTDAVGTYADAIEPYGEAVQGNYIVTYIPGDLTLVAKQRVVSLWITDHEDAGDGLVHLAFQPALNAGSVTETLVAEWGANYAIKVKCATTEAELENVKDVQPIIELRNGTGTQDLDKGWVWITVKVPDGAETDTDAVGLAWKIIIQNK